VKSTFFLNSIALLLFTLMLFKVSSFHAYTHQDNLSGDIENCTTCDLAIKNGTTEFIFPQTTDTVFHFICNETSQQDKGYNAITPASYYYYNFFGRPPPSLI